MKTYNKAIESLMNSYNENPSLANKAITISATGTAAGTIMASGLMTKIGTATVVATGKQVTLYTAAALGAKIAVGVGLTALSIYAGYSYYKSKK